MNIITKGRLPEAKVYRAECRNCGTVFEFWRSEAKLFVGPSGAEYLSAACPLDECEEKMIMPA